MSDPYFETPHNTPPIYPAGVNSIEARVKAIEVHLWHQARLCDTQDRNVGHAHKRISDLEDSYNFLFQKVTVWLIGAMGSAVFALAVVVFKVLSPNIFR
jgi:hypothetical protein